MRKFSLLFIAALTFFMVGCTRIETGEVGLRIDASKQVQGAELMPGSWNQTLVGDVLEFPVRDISVNLDNKQPLTAESVALADFDLVYVYTINPNSVSELWTQRSRSQHGYGDKGDIYLMNQYMSQLVNNAAYKHVREYPALKVADMRQSLEEKIRATVSEQLKSDKLENALTITLVQVRSILPPASILESAAEVVKSQNLLKVKENEVAIAEAEARRMKALSENSGNSIAYMDAQARLNISMAMLAGKVSTVVVPYDFKGIVNAK